MAIRNSDLILAFGIRFDDRATGTLKTYAPRAKKIHIEIDPSEVHKNVAVDVPLVGDLKTVLTDLIPMVDEYDHEEWKKEIKGWKTEADARSIMNWEDDGKLYVAHLVTDIWKATGGGAIVTTDVGQHQMWTAQYYQLEKPNRCFPRAVQGRWVLVCPPPSAHGLRRRTRKFGRSPVTADSR